MTVLLVEDEEAIARPLATLLRAEGWTVETACTADPARVLDLLARLGLEGKRRAFPAQLSGGQQQRVAIARALVTRPALLLADEPTGNLDSAASESVMRMLVQLNETTGQTIVMITHDEALALQAKRILRLRDGRIVKDEVRA